MMLASAKIQPQGERDLVVDTNQLIQLAVDECHHCKQEKSWNFDRLLSIEDVAG